MALITIARGTLGVATELANRLSKALDYRVVTREEVYDAAKAYGIEETGLGNLGFVDRQPPSLWHSFFSQRERYLACFQAAMMDAALSGNLIYVGHLGHLLLSGYRRVLRLRLVASDSYRVGLLVRERGMSDEQALAYIREVDERRLRWSQFLYGVDWRNCALYDLVINHENVCLETMTDAVTHIAQSEEMQPTPLDREMLSNLRLVALGRAALLRSSHTRGLDVTLEADAAGGHLRVSGVVPTLSIEFRQRDIRDVLRKIPGVETVEIVLRDDPFR